MRTKFKQWAVDYLPEHPEVVLGEICIEDEFFKDKKVSFEIGSGKGDFIIGMSKKYPDEHFVAVEKVKTVAGMMAKKLVDEEITNVKVFADDTIYMFEHIPVEYTDRIYLNFVDPWPKKRHEKRRLTHISFLKNYLRILKKNGLLVIKTDNDGLYQFTLEQLQVSEFEIIENIENYEFNPENDVMTEYERKFRGLGQPIHRVVAIKR